MRRARPWIAVIGAAIVFALIPLIGLPLFYALLLIGLALAAGSPPDYVADAKPVARRTRNLILGVLVLILLAVVVLQPQLNLWLVELFGLEITGLVVALVAAGALALPLAMADSATPIRDLPERRLVLTRRNLMLCLTVAVTVTGWYAGPGQSFLAIAALVLGLPIPLALSCWTRQQTLTDEARRRGEQAMREAFTAGTRPTGNGFALGTRDDFRVLPG
jgi:hypothetical protein